MVLPVVLLGAASVFADDSTARLDCYKSNRLIPAEFNLNNSDTSMDILFNQGSLTWDTFATNRKAKLNELAAKFAGLSLEDLENFKWWTGYDDYKMLINPDAASLADYLFAVQTGEITSDTYLLKRPRN